VESPAGEQLESVCRALAVAIGDAHLADRVTARAFARIYATGEPATRPAAPLYIAATRAARRRRRASRVSPATGAPAGTLERAIEELPSFERIAIVLHHHAGLAPDELARALRCSRAAVESALREAYRRLGVERDDGDDIPAVDLDEP